MGMVSKGMAACTSLSMNGHGVVQPGRCLSGGVVMNEATGRPFEHLGSELAVAGPSWRCALIVGIRALGVERALQPDATMSVIVVAAGPMSATLTQRCPAVESVPGCPLSRVGVSLWGEGASIDGGGCRGGHGFPGARRCLRRRRRGPRQSAERDRRPG